MGQKVSYVVVEPPDSEHDLPVICNVWETHPMPSDPGGLQPLDVQIPAGDLKDIGAAVAHERRYSLWGLFLGSLCILGGIALVINGLAGTSLTSGSLKILGATVKLNDAQPGIVLAVIIGPLVIWITKQRVTIAGK